MLEHKGYAGRITIDHDTGSLVGEVLDIRDVVTFEGQTARAAEQAFRDSVDDYLELCEQRGEQPDKPYSGKLLVRLGPELHAKVAAKAKGSGLSINQYICERLAD